MIEFVLLLNFVATTVMTGVIWFVQWVHYPLLASVPVDRAIETAVEHQRRTGQVLALPMPTQTPDDEFPTKVSPVLFPKVFRRLPLFFRFVQKVFCKFNVVFGIYV